MKFIKDIRDINTRIYARTRAAVNRAFCVVSVVLMSWRNGNVYTRTNRRLSEPYGDGAVLWGERRAAGVLPQGRAAGELTIERKIEWELKSGFRAVIPERPSSVEA